MIFKIIVAIALAFGVLIGLALLADKFGGIFTKMFKGFDKMGVEATISILSIVFLAFLSFASIPYTYSDGVKTGSITKFTKKGLIFKTWEGQLNLGGMTSDGDGGMVANVWNFSVIDEKLAEQLQSSQGRVSLKYDQHILVPIHEGSTSYIAKGLIK